jgi:hypothetical protein
MFAVAITCIDPWVLEFMVSHTTGSNQWENDISYDFNVRGYVYVLEDEYTMYWYC